MSETTIRRTLADVAEINPESLSGATPSGKEFRYVDLGAVTRGRVNWDAVSNTTFGGAPSRARRVTRGGDVLFGTVRPALESHAAIPPGSSVGEFIASTGFSVLRARPGLADSRFLAHYCFSRAVRDDARRSEVGSNYPAVNESDVRQFSFPCLSLKEQEQIAELLDALDDEIRLTSDVIEKVNCIRSAALENLLTQAGESGTTKKLGSVTSKIVDGVHHTPVYVRSGIPFITVENLTRGPGISLDPCRYVSRRAHVDYRKRIEPLPGDVLVSKDGTLGVARLVPQGFPEASVFVSVAVLRPITSVLTPNFLRLFFDTESFHSQLRVLSAGSGLQHIHLEHFREFTIPDLPTSVQEAIAATLAKFDRRISSEKAIMEKLMLQRVGLTDDLLSGRVRVPERVVS